MGSNSDFQEIYVEYYPKLVRYFTRLAGDSDAEDMAQETLIRVSKGLDQFRGDSSLSTWIYRIATNVVRDRFRSAAFTQDSVTEPVDGERLAALIDDTTAADGSLDSITIRKEMNT